MICGRPLCIIKCLLCTEPCTSLWYLSVCVGLNFHFLPFRKKCLANYLLHNNLRIGIIGTLLFVFFGWTWCLLAKLDQTYIVYIYIQGRPSRGFQGGTCTPAFLPSPGNSYIRRKKFVHPRNSPPRAPLLSRPDGRPWLLFYRNY